MNKVEISAGPFLYPMPVTIVGANVDGKPNYLAVSYIGIVNHDPPLISVALHKRHYSNSGIRENGTFSVNIPSVGMVVVTDYCGLATGHKVDKSGVFETFYGKLGSAPMVSECPLNLECRVVDTLEYPPHRATFIGEIVAAYSQEAYLTKGRPDIKKIDPIIYSLDNNYWRLGEFVGKAFSVGKDLLRKEASQTETPATGERTD